MIFFKWLSLVFWFVVLSSFAAEPPSVLLLNSYHPQYQWTEQLTQGVQDTINAEIPLENLHIEYMDARRFVDDSTYQSRLIHLLQHKYALYTPDIIITSDDAAYEFMIAHGDSLFPGLPVVFCGVNVFDPSTLIGKNNITGINEGMEIEGNLQLILQLQPNIKRIVLLGDVTGLGSKMVKRAQDIRTMWLKDTARKHIQLDILDHFSLKELYSTVEQLTPDTALLMLAIHKDKLGNYFSFSHDLPELTRRSTVPVYGMWGSLMIGNGAVGGKMNNPYEHGSSAAKIALDILSGRSVSSIPIQEKAYYAPYFDFNQLQRFGLEEQRLPKHSTVQYKPKSIYEQNSTLFNSLAGIVITLMLIISILSANIRKRKIAEVNLTTLNIELEEKVNIRTKDLDLRNRLLEEQTKELEKQALTDHLIEISNRRAAIFELGAYLTRLNVECRPFSLAILDLDFFKNINDSYGHNAGDLVLKTVGDCLKNNLRPDDRVYRWGGEEFLLLLPETHSIFSFHACERLRKHIENLTVPNIPKITVSIGWTSFEHKDSIESIIKKADDALYEAKANGRNQVKPEINQHHLSTEKVQML